MEWVEWVWWVEWLGKWIGVVYFGSCGGKGNTWLILKQDTEEKTTTCKIAI